MPTRLKLLLSFFAGVLLLSSTPYSGASAAASLQVQPLLVKEKLKPAESKKGFIDVSNPSGGKVTVSTKVQAFRQIDNRGNLQFSDSAELTAGIRPDLKEFELKPHETVRMFYFVDGRKLPTGDVFAAIFFSSIPAQSSKPTGASSGTSVQVGTLFHLVNGTPGPRQAEITSLKAPFISFGNGIAGTVRIRNTADPQKSTGFFPTVTAKLEPLGPKTTKEGRLLFAGISRDMPFSLKADRIGIYKLTVTTEGDSVSRWVFLATGYWRWVAIALLLAVAAAGFLFIRWRRRKTKLTYTSRR